MRSELNARPTALITQNSLFTLAGSETLTFELASHLSAIGWTVTVATNGIGATWQAAFAAIPNVEVVIFGSPELDRLLEVQPPDMAWIHHQMVPRRLLTHRGSTKVIFNHMSEFHPLEFPFSNRVERSLAHLVTFNSPSTRTAQLATGVFDGVDERRLLVLGNPAPDAFWRHPSRYVASRPRLLVASNHLPPEVLEAVELLRDDWEVTVAGLEAHKGATPLRVTPDVLREHDAVLTIGKTVQYSIVSGTPVYVYDIFGGPGWLSQSNVELARFHNFSGRGFERKTGDLIARELREGLTEARQSARELHGAHAQEFLWSSTWERVQRALDDCPPPVDDCDPTSIVAFALSMDARNDAAKIAAHHEALSEQHRAVIADLQSRLEHSEATMARIAGLPGFPMVRLGYRALRVLRDHMRAWGSVEQWRELLWVRWRSGRLFHRVYAGRWRQLQAPRVVAITRVRNEELLLEDTLNHLATIADCVVVYDDASTDLTLEIALAHPAVAEVVRNRRWRAGRREWEETASRRALHQRASRLNPEWFFYSDADERFSGGIRDYLLSAAAAPIAGVRISLFDAYITDSDQRPYEQGKPLWSLRSMFGPERRDILMAWRHAEGVAYRGRDSREPQGVTGEIVTRFACQHYGKALSVEHWEDTCKYYAEHFPKYADKWRDRMGKAIHVESDFGRELVSWDEVLGDNVPM